MSGREIIIVLCLCLVSLVVCGVSQHCAQSMNSVDRLCTFIAGGMMALAQAQFIRRQHRSSDDKDDTKP